MFSKKKRSPYSSSTAREMVPPRMVTPRTALLLALLVKCRGASDTEPHYHNGKLAPYELGPPSLLLSEADEADLATGNAIMQVPLCVVSSSLPAEAGSCELPPKSRTLAFKEQ